MAKPLQYTDRSDQRFHSYCLAEFAPSYTEVLEQLHLGTEDKVLEFASGRGDEAKRIRESTGAMVVEFEVGPAGYETSPGPERNFAIGHPPALPYADNSFSAIHCKDSLAHVSDKETLFAEFRRVLKPDGLILLTTEATRGFDEHVNDLMAVISSKLGIFRQKHYFPITRKRLNVLVQKAGFKIEKDLNWVPEPTERNWYHRNRAVLVLRSTKE